MNSLTQYLKLSDNSKNTRNKSKKDSMEKDQHHIFFARHNKEGKKINALKKVSISHDLTSDLQENTIFSRINEEYKNNQSIIQDNNKSYKNYPQSYYNEKSFTPIKESNNWVSKIITSKNDNRDYWKKENYLIQNNINIKNKLNFSYYYFLKNIEKNKRNRNNSNEANIVRDNEIDNEKTNHQLNLNSLNNTISNNRKNNNVTLSKNHKKTNSKNSNYSDMQRVFLNMKKPSNT